MRTTAELERQPRSILVSFVGPVATGEATIELARLRRGGSTTGVGSLSTNRVTRYLCC